MMEELLATQEIATRASDMLVRGDFVGINEVLECVLAGWSRRSADVCMSMDAIDGDRDCCWYVVLASSGGFAVAGSHCGGRVYRDSYEMWYEM